MSPKKRMHTAEDLGLAWDVACITVPKPHPPEKDPPEELSDRLHSLELRYALKKVKGRG